MRCLYFIPARFNLLLSAVHIAGAANGLADALSRNNLPLFLSNYPQANSQGSTVPDSLVNLLVDSKPDWTSPSWSSMFSFIFDQHYQNPHCAPTPQTNEDTMTSAPVPAIAHSPHQSQFSVNLSASSARSNSSTRLSSPICQTSASSKLPKVVPTPLSGTC